MTFYHYCRIPHFGVTERGHPDLFQFVPISPFSSDLFRFAVLVFGNAPIFCSDFFRLFRFLPISSDFFRFVFRTNQNKSGKPLSADPFCKSPILELTRRGAVPVKIGTGNDFPRNYQRIPQNYFQYWCWNFVTFLPFSTVLVVFRPLTLNPPPSWPPGKIFIRIISCEKNARSGPTRILEWYEWSTKFGDKLEAESWAWADEFQVKSRDNLYLESLKGATGQEYHDWRPSMGQWKLITPKTSIRTSSKRLRGSERGTSKTTVKIPAKLLSKFWKLVSTRNFRSRKS